jgi:hypothetical protein
MSIFTFILEYSGGTYIKQLEADGVKRARDLWAERIDLNQVHGLTQKSASDFRELFTSNDVVLLDGLRNVWCQSRVIRNKLALLNIVKTDLS